MPADLLPDVLSVAQMAELLDCSAETVEDQTRRGLWPGLKTGRSWRYPRTAVLEALHARAMANFTPAAPASMPAPAAKPVALPVAAPSASTLQLVGSRSRRRAPRCNPPPLPDPPAGKGAAC